ncbi:hypothetical protein PV326_003008 [Microctonus aethiopoides]|uniref:Uncharacterized protein n=1 Tax=Microctonus aethiopoides TaxID=144406 RepID=A0AA39C7W4_9HYME|nr:hypothetical protein PV326_003008 [Microctonus aethiopoides]KAK0159214.1 hypothetical protein PV328_010125 [Microctonus aethiopoides]
MASYKAIFTIVILSISLTTGLPTLVKSTSSKYGSNLGGLKQYSFPDDYFNVKAHHATDEQHESTDNCEQVVKKGMICQVCTDPDTNGKHEQCSYASPSYKKARDYEKSKKKPEKYNKKDFNSQSLKRQALKRQEDSAESKETDDYKSFSSGYSRPSKRYNNDDDEGNDNNSGYVDQSSRSSYVPESERISKNVKKHECEEIERDGMTCMVCKDSETGGNFEKCSFAYQPKEKIYKYSKSKSIGTPKDKKLKKKPIEKSQSLRRSASSELTESDATDMAETQQVADDNGCRDVFKDSMTCKVCVHPVTKENSEQCSYSYSPDDKLYAYTRSSSFGTPKKYSSSDSDDE